MNSTPTDCINLMINEIMQSYVLDLVLSGINRGANVSKNITYSDAVTAVMKGAFR